MHNRAAPRPVRPMLVPVDDADVWVAAILRRQGGVIARRQALGTGMTTGRVRTKLDTARWATVHPSVYRSAEHPFSCVSRVTAAALWAGANGYLYGHAAAWWWGLTPIEPGRIAVVIPPRENRRGRIGIEVIRRPLPSADRAWYRSTQVTGVALSALAGSVALGPGGGAVLDRALQTKVSLPQVRAAYYRNLGTRGSKDAGELLRAAANRSAAVSERIFVKLLREGGIHGWRVNHPWEPASRSTIDVAFVAERLAIEIDGWAWHHTPDRFQRDRTKQNQLTAAGWTVLRFTWFDLTERPREVVRAVRDAVRRATDHRF